MPPPILTDAELDKFVAWLDAEVAEVEQAKVDAETISDPLTAAKYRVESIAFRMVALKLRASQVVDATE